MKSMGQYLVVQEPKRQYRQTHDVLVAVVFTESAVEAVRVGRQRHNMELAPEYKKPYAVVVSLFTTYHF